MAEKKYIAYDDAFHALDTVAMPLSTYECLVGHLGDIPAADVALVRHGRWIKKFYYRQSTQAYDCEMYSCSECGNEFSYDAETGMCMCNWGYCPNCGAKMDGSVNDAAD